MPVITSSLAALQQLYSSLCSAIVSGNTNSVQNSVMDYLIIPNDSARYSSMANAIVRWLNSNGPTEAVGISGGGGIVSLRVQIIEADGTTSFDSNACGGSVGSYTIGQNLFDNINKPSTNFITTGKYIINENQGNRSYNMGAWLSQTGVFTQFKYSNSTGVGEQYLAVRQGKAPSNPLGNIVVSLYSNN